MQERRRHYLQWKGARKPAAAMMVLSSPPKPRRQSSRNLRCWGAKRSFGPWRNDPTAEAQLRQRSQRLICGHEAAAKDQLTRPPPRRAKGQTAKNRISCYSLDRGDLAGSGSVFDHTPAQALSNREGGTVPRRALSSDPRHPHHLVDGLVDQLLRHAMPAHAFAVPASLPSSPHPADRADRQTVSCFPARRSIAKKPVHPSICRKTLGLDPRRTGARRKAARRKDSLLRDRSGGTLRLFCFFNHISARHTSCMSPRTSPSRSTRRMKRVSRARPPRYSHW